MKESRILRASEKQKVSYCIPLWLRDEQIIRSTSRIKGRIEPHYDLKTDPCAIVCYGPSLKDTWEQIKDFKYVFTCSGSHRFLIERNIIPTWHVEVDPRSHKVELIGPPHKDVEYLIASTCSPAVFDHLEGFNVKLWHVFDGNDDALRTLPPGEWALTGGSGVGLRAMTIARFFGFQNQHIFGMDGSEGLTGKHAAAHPNQPKDSFPCEYPEGSGVIYKTTPAMLECARQTFHELNQLRDVKATFYGEGLVQAMAKDYKPQPAPSKTIIGYNKPELISKEMRELNSRLHEENLGYGVGGGKYAEKVLKMAEGMNTKSILDYGCGKGYLAKAIPFPIWEYDPAIPGKDVLPRPADLVICTDVLEHIEPDKLDVVLDDLQRCVRQVGYFVVHTGPAKKSYADGRNAHLLQKDEKWWGKKLSKFFDVAKIVVQTPELHIIVGPKTAITQAVTTAPKVVEVSKYGTTAKFLIVNDTTKFRVDTLFIKEPVTIDWLNRMKSGDILFDVGANVGSYSVWAAKRGVRVFSFEPAAQNYGILCSNIVLNKLEDRVTAYCLALSDKKGLGTLQLSSQEVGAACHQFGHTDFPKMVQGCVGMTLDDLVSSGELPQPTHVKIDVDGVEPLIVRGGVRTLKKASSVLVEIDEASASHQSAIANLQSLGLNYRPHQVDQARRTTGNFKGYAEYLFTRDRDWIESLIDNILNTPVQEDPYPHLCGRGMFPPSMYSSLLANLNIPYTPISEARSLPGYPAREVGTETPFWKTVHDQMCDGRLKSAICAKFEIYKPSYRDETLLIRDASNYSIGPHTDAVKKRVTLLFYLAEDNTLAEVGTSIYVPKNRDFKCVGGPHYPLKGFDKVKTVPMVPNSLFAFKKTDNSFHGVEPVEHTGYRHILLYDIQEGQ